MPDPRRFSRRTIIEAANLLPYLDHAEFDNLMIRLSVEDFVTHGTGLSKENKVNELLRFATSSPLYQTDDGTIISDAIVEEAARLAHPSRDTQFVRSLARDGFALTDDGRIRSTLPETAELPQAEDEVHRLMEELGFTVAKGHLDQAIDNHARGNLAASNGELRKVLENLLDEIAERLEPQRATTARGHPRRQLLADREPPFLFEALGEWSDDGKNLVNGVFKRLHREGGHPGLSGPEDCTFRLHLVILLARLFLHRAKEFGVRPS